MPGCSKRAALRAAGLPESGLGHARPLNRAITAGLIIADYENAWVRRPACALFANERDRTLFSLRHELLHGQPSPDRAAEIMAEVDKLRQEQAADFAQKNAR